jgi:uncharacterized OsmC-like protein
VSLSSLIADTRKAVADDSANAQALFTAEGALGGADVAANPVQYALASLGSCQAITYQFWAEQLGIGFDTLSVRVEGDLDVRGFFGFDDGVRPGFSAVRVEVTVTGPESPERYQDLAAAVDRHCPVLDLFANPVPVTRTLTS